MLGQQRTKGLSGLGGAVHVLLNRHNPMQMQPDMRLRGRLTLVRDGLQRL